MAASAEEFVLKLNDQVSGPAQASKGALAQLESQIAAGQNSIKQMEAALQVMKGAANQDVAAINELTQSIALGKALIGDAQSAYVQMGGAAEDALNAAANAAAAEAQAQRDAAQAVKDAAKAAKEAADKQKQLAEAEQAAADKARAEATPSQRELGQAATLLGGRAGAAAFHIERFGGMIAKLGPYGIAAAVALGVLIGAIAGFIAIALKGIEAAGQLRDELLKFEGAAKGSVAAGKQVQAAVDAVSASSALSRDKIAAMAVQLEQAGLKGKQLQTALGAMATAASAGGQEAADAFLKQAKAAAASGGSVDALAKKIQKQLGGVAKEQALSFGAQMEKLHESITAIFSGANIEPFLKGLHAILSLFDQNSAAGKSLKNIITSVTNFAIGAFLKTAIALVRLYISIKQSTVALTAVKIVLYTIIATFAILAAIGVVVLALLAMGAILTVLPFLLVIAAVVAIVMAIQALWNKAKSINWSSIGNGIKNAFLSAVAFVASLPGKFVAIGSAIIRGIVSGLQAAGGAVLSALTGIVGSAVSGVKSMLGIHSPSRVFAQMGGHMAEGMSQGLDAGAPDVNASARGMAVGAAKGAAVSAKGGKNGASFSFTNCVFGEGLTKEMLREWMLDIFEQDLSNQGAHS